MCLPWKGAITTNYDELLEDALRQIERSFLPVTLEQNLDLTPGPHLPLYKVHGSMTDVRQVVLDGQSYAAYHDRYPLLVADFESLLRKHSVVYWGCSMTDPRLLDWLRRLGPEGRADLKASCVVITEGDWTRIPDEARLLLDEAHVRPVLLQRHDGLPGLIRRLVQELGAGPEVTTLHFTVSFVSEGTQDRWRVETDAGAVREVDAPWKADPKVGLALRDFQKLAEARIYRVIGAGRTTLAAVREARDVLASGGVAVERGVFRWGERGPQEEALRAGFPFAWAQLVLYHRGPNHPLSLPVEKRYVEEQEAQLERRFEGEGDRRYLTAGFIGRRRERHAVRRRLREGGRVFVFQGLGGLGKTTLAFQTLRLLAAPEGPPPLVFWCGELAHSGAPAAELVRALSEYGQGLFGSQWGGVAFALDRQTGDDPAVRFQAMLGVLTSNLPRLVVYFDNLESLMHGPETQDAAAFGTWRSSGIEAIWQAMRGAAEESERLALVASVRYRHADFEGAYVPVTELGSHAVFRLMAWFPTLRRLSAATRARLVERLQGHPRAVEFLDGLLRDALKQWERRRGPWRTPDTEAGEQEEWKQLVVPALPKLSEKLQDDLLLEALWANVLDERARPWRGSHRREALTEQHDTSASRPRALGATPQTTALPERAQILSYILSFTSVQSRGGAIRTGGCPPGWRGRP